MGSELHQPPTLPSPLTPFFYTSELLSPSLFVFESTLLGVRPQLLLMIISASWSAMITPNSSENPPCLTWRFYI